MSRLLLVVALLASRCDLLTPRADDTLAAGVWGGDDAGLIVSDTGAHAHIGCTAGNVVGAIPLDSLGHFDVVGTYHVQLYPVAIGEPRPARFTGRAQGSRLTLTVTLTDTAVVVGPVELRFGVEPEMAMCPICRVEPSP